MKYKIKILLLASFFIMFPLVASADVSLFPIGYWGPLVSCIGINCNTCHLFSTAQMVIYFIMTLTLFVVAPIMVTWGGIMMLISGGNEERFTSGRKMATGAVIGILIALGAFLIVNTLLATIAKQIGGFSGSGFTIQCSATSPYNPTQNQSSPPPGYTCPTDSRWVSAGAQCEYSDGSTTTPAPTGSNDTNRGDNGEPAINKKLIPLETINS